MPRLEPTRRALYGAVSMGGTVTIETAPFSDVPRIAAAVGYGSYETKRRAVRAPGGRAGGTGGYMDFDAAGDYVPHFIPAATRHVLGEVRVEF